MYVRLVSWVPPSGGMTNGEVFALEGKKKRVGHEPNPFSVIPAKAGTHESFNGIGVENDTLQVPFASEQRKCLCGWSRGYRPPAV